MIVSNSAATTTTGFTFHESETSDFTSDTSEDYFSHVVTVATSFTSVATDSLTSSGFKFSAPRRSWGPSTVTIAGGSALNIFVIHRPITSLDPAWLRSQRARRAALIGVRKRAERRAEGLLGSWLTEKQTADLEEKGWFDVRVPSSDGSSRTYRIRRGVAGNVNLLGPDGRAIKRFCAHPDGIPSPDVMLSQKLMLETNEDMFLRIANVRQL